MDGHHVTILFRGPGSLEQYYIPSPEQKVITAFSAYEIGDEVESCPGWFVHEVHEGMPGSVTPLTYVVELAPPPGNGGDTSS